MKPLTILLSFGLITGVSSIETGPVYQPVVPAKTFVITMLLLLVVITQLPEYLCVVNTTQLTEELMVIYEGQVRTMDPSVPIAFVGVK